MEDFRKILRDLQKIAREEGLESVDPNVLFDSAVRIYNSHLINKPRTSKSNGQGQQPKNVPMTDRQKELLRTLDYCGPMNLTKREAINLIQSELEKQKAQ